MMGQTVPLASLQMTENWDERLIGQGVMLPSSRTLRLEKWADRNLMELKKKCRVLCLGGTILCINICWGTPSWKATQQKRIWWSWWHHVDHKPAMCPCCKED